MNSKERFLNTLKRKPVDRLPVTTHDLMPSYLDTYMEGRSNQDFFDHFFEADLKLPEAFADEAHKCTY